MKKNYSNQTEEKKRKNSLGSKLAYSIICPMALFAACSPLYATVQDYRKESELPLPIVQSGSLEYIVESTPVMEISVEKNTLEEPQYITVSASEDLYKIEKSKRGRTFRQLTDDSKETNLKYEKDSDFKELDEKLSTLKDGRYSLLVPIYNSVEKTTTLYKKYDIRTTDALNKFFLGKGILISTGKYIFTGEPGIRSIQSYDKWYASQIETTPTTTTTDSLSRYNSTTGTVTVTNEEGKTEQINVVGTPAEIEGAIEEPEIIINIGGDSFDGD